MKDLFELMRANEYPGRGIMLGKTQDGASAVIAYFIMGRSVNSRNRVFTVKGSGIITEPADKAVLEDPSLIIYAPVRVLGSATIVTNGDQTDTIYDTLCAGKGFAKALRKRRYEPDAPNFTPRISGLVKLTGSNMSYRLSILKAQPDAPENCQRFFYEYDEPSCGIGHLIHTYKGNGSPIPSFEGEPVAVELKGNIDAFGEGLWQSLNEDNKVSLFVRYIDLASGDVVDRIYNKYDKID